MIPPLPADERRKILEAAFWMPAVQTMVSRKSSITNAFVCAIIPVIAPSLDEIEQALTILNIDPRKLTCSYCGDKASEWDHLRPLVRKRRPTGFITEIGNLVPACGKCNQSKGNKPWREWMLSMAPLSPTGRNIADVAERVVRLEAYECWRPPTLVTFETILSPDESNKYWKLCEDVIEELQKCQEVANELRVRITQSIVKSK